MADLSGAETRVITEQQAQELITQWLSRDEVVVTTRRGIKEIVRDNGDKLSAIFSDKYKHPEIVLTHGLIARWHEFLGKREQQAKETLLTQEMSQLEREIPDLENEVSGLEARLREIQETERNLVKEVNDLEERLKPARKREESFKNNFQNRKIEQRDFPSRETVLRETKKFLGKTYEIIPLSESLFDSLFPQAEDELKTIFSDFPEQGTEEQKKEWFAQKKREFLEVFYRKLTSFQNDFDRENQVIGKIIEQLGKQTEYSEQKELIEKIKDQTKKEAALRHYHQEILFHFLLTSHGGDIFKVFPGQQLPIAISKTIDEFDPKSRETAKALKEKQNVYSAKLREKEETEAILTAKRQELEKKQKRKLELTEKGTKAIQSLNLGGNVDIQTIIQQKLLRFKEKPPLDSYTIYSSPSYEKFINSYAQEGWGAELVKDLLGEKDHFLTIGEKTQLISQWLGKALEGFHHFWRLNIENYYYHCSEFVNNLNQILEALRSGREIKVITNPFSFKPFDPILRTSNLNLAKVRQEMVDSVRRLIQENGLDVNDCIIIGPLVLFPDQVKVVLSSEGEKHFGRFDGFIKKNDPNITDFNFLNDQGGLFGFLWEQKAISEFLLLV